MDFFVRWMGTDVSGEYWQIAFEYYDRVGGGVVNFGEGFRMKEFCGCLGVEVVFVQTVSRQLSGSE